MSELIINPQLCKTYNPDKFKWDRPWIAEPKFDGLRCIIIVSHKGRKHRTRWTESFSRNGKPLWNMNPILAEIEEKYADSADLILDGEVYAKDWNLSMSIVKRATKSHPDQDQLRFHVWDCLTLKEWKARKSPVSNLARKERLLPLESGKYIEVVKGQVVNTKEELQNAYAEFLAQGYEGALLKDPNGIYELGRRSPYWLKVKPWHDADLTCTGAYPGEGKHLGRIGGLALEGTVEWNDKSYTVRTEVGTGFTDEERIFFQGLSDAGCLAGRVIEIKFQEVTVDGSCRFPVYHRLRDDR